MKHVTPHTFTDPKDLALYHALLDDVMINIFDDREEQKVFRAALEGMKCNYPDILGRKQKNMFYCPASFNYDSRIGTYETSVPGALDEAKSALESKTNLNFKEKKHLKLITRHLQNIQPQLAEAELVDALSRFFYKHRGIFLCDRHH